MLLLLVALLPVLFVTFCFYVRHSDAMKLICKIPGLQGLPVVGNAFQFLLPSGLADCCGWDLILLSMGSHDVDGVPRMVREAIEIKKHPNFNREDGWRLSTSWDPILSKIKSQPQQSARPQDTINEIFRFLREIYRRYKGINQVNSFGLRAVNIYDPEDIETILSTQRYNDKLRPYTYLQPWLGTGLLISNGSKWQHRRKMLTPAFHFNILKRYTQAFIEQTQVFLDKVQTQVGKEVDLPPLIARSTLNIMCETAMGISMHEDIETSTKNYFEAIHTLGNCVVQRLTRIWYILNFIYNRLPAGRIQAKSLEDLHSFTDKVIKERKKNFSKEMIADINDNVEVYGKKGRLAMLDLLLQNESDNKIDLKGIREEVDTFMFEGHDTTSMALSFMIMRIANEKEIQDKIYEELKKIFGDSDRLPTMDDLFDMKYLECCIKESLRLYPSVPFIARYLYKDAVLSGYNVPAKTNCFIHIYDMHHREDLYPEPEKFIPERFTTENSTTRHAYAYIPFSAGPRNCIGQKFAMLEMKTMMSGLLRRFRLEPITKTEEVSFTVDLVLRANHPIYVRFVERR